MLKKQWVTVILLLATSAVFASDDAFPRLKNIQRDSFYGYLGAGFVDQEGLPPGEDFSNSSLTLDSSTGSSLEQTTTGARIAVGYLPLREKRVNFGLEVGVTSFGRAKYASDVVSQSLELNYYGADVLAVIHRRLFDHGFFTTKLGVVREFVDTATTNLMTDVSPNDEYLFESILVLGYDISDKLSVSFSYIRTFGNPPDLENAGDANNTPSMDMGLIGISRRF